MKSRIVSFVYKLFPSVVKALQTLRSNRNSNPPAKGRIHRVLSRMGISIGRRADGTFGIVLTHEKHEIDSNIEDSTTKNTTYLEGRNESITDGSNNQ